MGSCRDSATEHFCYLATNSLYIAQIIRHFRNVAERIDKFLIKGIPIVRLGRKATGLRGHSETAGLPAISRTMEPRGSLPSVSILRSICSSAMESCSIFAPNFVQSNAEELIDVEA